MVREEAIPIVEFRRSDARSLMCHIGYRDDDDTNYWIKVGLDVCPGVGLDFNFFLVRVHGEPEAETPMFESLQVASFIGAADRRKIRQVLIWLAERLITSVMPERFAMSTYDAYLPDGAMTKFTELCLVFNACGYDITATDPYRGRHMWIMERQPG